MILLNESSDRDFKLLFTRGTQLLHEKRRTRLSNCLNEPVVRSPTTSMCI